MVIDSLKKVLLFDLLTSYTMFIWVGFVVKSLLIYVYAGFIYFAVKGLKRLGSGKLGARVGYYCWYLLLLAFPLSGLDYNAFIKIPVYEAYVFDVYGTWVIFWVISVLWLLILLYRLESQVITFIKLEGAIGVMEEANVGALKERAAAAFKLSAGKIRIVTANWVNSPVSYGVFKKTILLPQDFATRYSERELHLLLLHEMAHIKNGDTVKLHLISLAQCLFPLPPGFVKRFKLDTEILCDNMVLGVERAEAESYGDLLLKESMCKAAPIKGLAFSDSYRALERRVDAIFEIAPEKRRFSLLAGLVFVMLAGSFVWSYFTPDAWFSAAYPEEPRYDIITFYEDEDYYTVSEEYLGALMADAPMPVSRNERPAKELFDGTYEFQGNDIKVDKFAIAELLKPMEKPGKKPQFVEFLFMNYELTTEHRTPSGFSVYLGDLDLTDESMRYDVIDTTNFNEYLYAFLAHWI